MCSREKRWIYRLHVPSCELITLKELLYETPSSSSSSLCRLSDGDTIRHMKIHAHTVRVGKSGAWIIENMTTGQEVFIGQITLPSGLLA